MWLLTRASLLCLLAVQAKQQKLEMNPISGSEIEKLLKEAYQTPALIAAKAGRLAKWGQLRAVARLPCGDAQAAAKDGRRERMRWVGRF